MGTEDIEDELLEILEDKTYYSISTEYVLKKLDIESLGLSHIITRIKGKRGIQINIFKYADIEYIGLESRRLDYERDKENGINHVEKLIEKGFYDKQDYSFILILILIIGTLIYRGYLREPR